MRYHIFQAACFAAAIASATTLARAQCSDTFVCNEFATLESAMTVAFIDTGFFHPIEDLDDRDDPNATNAFDDINDGGGTPVLLQSTGRFRLTPENLTEARCSDFFAAGCWRGPYVTFQPVRIDPTSTYDPGTLRDIIGTGQPYYLYSPLGLVEPETQTISLTGHGDTFDRWAFVSAGSDGILGNGDDHIRLFGTAPTETVISSVLSATLRGAGSDSSLIIAPGSTIRVRGYNFGTSQGVNRILLDGADLGAATSWTQTEIVIDLSPGATGSLIEIEVGGTVRDSFAVQIVSAVESWSLFE